MQKRILQEIHPLNLIREVEKWPVLYEKDNPERANMHLKYKMWLEVSKALFEDWDTYSKAVQELKVQQLTRKWRNLRDTFKRHVEKKSREGNDANKKSYVYFKYMLFLLPHIRQPEDPPEEPLPEFDEYLAKKRKSSRISAKTEKRKLSVPTAVDGVPSTAKVSKEDDAIDEDKHFLLSLVPTFKKMNDDEKLMAKMQILKVIRDVKNKNKKERNKPAAELMEYVQEPFEPIKVEFFNVEDATESDSETSDHNSV